jgi:ribonucleoside-diphosphate reductase alpha chain
MDYIFRWLNLRFLSGAQLSLFAGLAPQASQLPAPPTMIPESEPEEEVVNPRGQWAKLAEEVAWRLHQVGGQSSGPGFGNPGGAGGGIAPEAESGLSINASASSEPSLTDRGIYHAADAMKDMFEMGDAPSCSVCGAIMVRNGSCYRCMSCGSTSGCS